MHNSKRVRIITGASKGIGHELLKYVFKKEIFASLYQETTLMMNYLKLTII